VVGVIVPVRGFAAYLAETLDCVLGQDPAPAEVVVVDDASDEPLALHPDHAGRCTLVRRDVRGGPAAARASGLEALDEGIELVALCDADDAWAAGKLAAQLDALERHPDLRELEFRVLGAGPQREALARRAAAGGLPVRFDGFAEDVQSALAEADGLLHLCPVESFGLVVLEGMAARVPVLVPDQGGTRCLVEHEVSGYQFPANDVEGLAAMLRRLAHAPAQALNRAVETAHRRLVACHSEAACMHEYRRLIEAAA
jgi:glycosyltransferase involved in cell wall biosynthesis